MSKTRIVRITGIILVAVLAIGLGLRLTWADKSATGPGQSSVLDPTTYISATVPDEENAALWLRAASEALVLSKDQINLVGDLTVIPVEEWTPAQHEQVRSLLEQARPAMDLLKRSLRLTRTSYGLDLDDLKSVMLNSHKLPLLDMIRLQRFLYVVALDSLERGDREGFLSAVTPMPLLAVSAEREAPLIATLVGVACDKIMLDAIRQAIARPETDVPTLDQLERLIPDNDLREVWKRTIASEFALGSLRSGQGTAPLGQPIPPGDDAWRSATIAAFVETFDHPFGSVPDWVSEQQRRIEQATKGGPDVQTENLVKAVGRFQYTSSARRLAHFALALRREAIRTGSYPRTLVSLRGASQPDPFAGTLPVLSVNPDGSAVLAIANGYEIYKRVWTDVHPAKLHTWQLPAPPRR